MARDPDAPVILKTANTDAEAGVIASTLREHGIDARVIDAAGSMLSIFGPALNQPIQVVVRRADAERAASILRTTREESVDLDWSEVDVGSSPADEDEVAGVTGGHKRALGVVILILVVIVIVLFTGVVF